MRAPSGALQAQFIPAARASVACRVAGAAGPADTGGAMNKPRSLAAFATAPLRRMPTLALALLLVAASLAVAWLLPIR